MADDIEKLKTKSDGYYKKIQLKFFICFCKVHPFASCAIADFEYGLSHCLCRMEWRCYFHWYHMKVLFFPDYTFFQYVCRLGQPKSIRRHKNIRKKCDRHGDCNHCCFSISLSNCILQCQGLWSEVQFVLRRLQREVRSLCNQSKVCFPIFPLHFDWKCNYF